MNWKINFSAFWRTTSWISDDPLAMVHQDGSVRLDGEYTPAQLREILEFAEARLTRHQPDAAISEQSEGQAVAAAPLNPNG